MLYLRWNWTDKISMSVDEVVLNPFLRSTTIKGMQLWIGEQELKVPVKILLNTSMIKKRSIMWIASKNGSQQLEHEFSRRTDKEIGFLKPLVSSLMFKAEEVQVQTWTIHSTDQTNSNIQLVTEML